MLDSSLFGRTNDTEILNQSNEFFIIFLLQTDTVGHRWTSIFSALGAGGRVFESLRPDHSLPLFPPFFPFLLARGETSPETHRPGSSVAVAAAYLRYAFADTGYPLRSS